MKNFVVKIFTVVGVVLFFFIFQITYEYYDYNKSFEHGVEKIIGKNIYIPDNLRMLFPFSKNSLDSVELATSELKIYTYVNVSCPKCILEIEDWVDFFKQIEKHNVSLIFVCGSDYDDFNTILYLLENQILNIEQHHLFADSSNSFIENNSFMKENMHFKTFLTDRSGGIIYAGNPIYSERIKDIYIEKIIEWRMDNSKKHSSFLK